MNFIGFTGWVSHNKSSGQKQNYRRRIGHLGTLIFASLLAYLSIPLLSLFLALPLSLPLHAQEIGIGRVTPVGVNDQAFPAVSVYLDVMDAAGAPVTGLTQANFAIQEDGQVATVQAVSADASQPLALLMTLDRSTDAATWAAIQASAAAVINGLGENDQVAITTIFEEVQVVQGFTADKSAALASLAAVTAGGQFSAINPALLDAVNRFTDDLPARRAIILVADAPDNISGLTMDEVVPQITGRGTPIYVVGFGDRVQSEASFAQVATATGGRFFAIGAATDLQANLTALLPQLRQGYRLDFVSALPADNLGHTAQIQVTAPNVSGMAVRQFVARLTTLTVTIPNLVSGQPVAGVVNLSAVATSPAPVASVEFRVDDQSIGIAPNLETPIAWDTSTLEPGPHTLTAVVTDSAGNQGEARVEILVASSAPRLDLIRVDQTHFPQITTYVDAFGANGLPLMGLNAQSFTVAEDNRPVEAAQIAVVVDGSQSLNLVLVLDRSVGVGDWAQLRNAVNGVIDGLRPQDQMALYTFAGSPTLVQGVTGDKNTLKNALAMVEPAPPVTPATPATDNGLHQALLDGLNLAGTLPPGRHAVVVLTNGTDNTGQIALGDMISVLQTQPVPVHLLAFGVDGQSAGTLAGIAQVAGGNSVSVSNAADLRSALQTLTALLQQGYRLDFTSAMQADDNRHELTIGLSAGGLEAEIAGEFVARSRSITVTFPHVTPGSTVAGQLNLTAQAETPAPIHSVVYRLNGDILAEVADTSFSIVWNSETVAPGPYNVEVTVVDVAGNEGTATVSFTVVAPVAIVGRLAASNSDGDIMVGDEVTIEADGQGVDGPPRVEFYVDQALIGTDDQPPYRISFDSSVYEAGNHTITLLARDDAGRQAISTIDFALVALILPTPVPTPAPASLIPVLPAMNWGRLLTWAAIGLVVLVAALMILSALRKVRQSAAEQKLTPMRLTLSNLGNVATGYLLRGEDSAGILTFRFSLNGMVLGLPPVARLTHDESPALARSGLPGLSARPNFGGIQMPNLPSSGQSNGQSNGHTGEPGTASTMEDLADKLDEASGVGRILSSLIMSVSYFLPNSLARPLRTLSMYIRRGQMAAQRVKYVRRQFDNLNKTRMGAQLVQNSGEAATQVGRVATAESTRDAVTGGANRAGGVLSSTAAAAYAGASRTANRLYDLSGQAVQNGELGQGTNGGSGVAAVPGSRQWVYLPPISPGETVMIDVMVGARTRTNGDAHQAFRILSRALGEENAQPVIEEGSLKLATSSRWPAILRLILTGVFVLVAGVVIWWLAGRLF